MRQYWRHFYFYLKLIIFSFAILVCHLGFIFLIENHKNKDEASAEELPDIVINEIAWMGTAVSSSNEWLELKNTSESEIDLTGWMVKAVDSQPSIILSGKIPASGYLLLERTSDETVSGIAADIIYTGALSNSGENLELRDANSSLIDNIDSSGGWPAGDNTAKTTMERKIDGGWQTSTNPGGTPKAENSSGEPITAEPVCGDGTINDNEECDDGNNINNDGCSDDCRIENQEAAEEENNNEEIASTTDDEDADLPHSDPLLNKENRNSLGDVVINELVSDPGDNEVEWLEIYNTKNITVELNGWTLEEGSGAKTNLSGALSSGSGRFKIIEKPKGNLNNSGDILILRDNTGRLIDQVAYGAYNDGDTQNNAPLAGDPYSLARKFDGYNTFNNKNDWEITSVITKGKSNIINNPDEEQEFSEEDKSIFDYSKEIIISEIFPNPAGSDSEDEFLEIYNYGASEVNLSGWVLGDSSKRKYEIKNNVIIKAYGYIAFNRKETKIALNNGGDTVSLYQPLKENPVQTVKYEKAKEGWSYAYPKDEAGFMAAKNNWTWSEIVTPGKVNEIKAPNHPPVVDFDYPEKIIAGEPAQFDSSDSVDEDNDFLVFSWDFGDKVKSQLATPQHTFLKTGSFTVELTVYDGKEKIKKEKIVTVEALNANIANSQAGLNSGIIVINEIMPDPDGSDAEEWIELYNQGETKINLLDWRIEDSGGKENAFKFTDDRWLDINNYLLLKREESKLSLNNTGDTVSLFDFNNKLIDKVKYDQAASGQAFARNSNGIWEWTIKATPGILNTVVAKQTLVKTVSKISKTKKSQKIIITSLEKISELEIGDLVKVKGIVAVLPGILGSQYFYIIGSPGIQVYNYKKDFPKLAVGDLIEVDGELSEANDERRVKTGSQANIKMLEHKPAPAAKEITCEKINESYATELVAVSGEVTQRKGGTLFLDDGTDEVNVYIKKTTGINYADYKAGDNLKITGILTRTKTGTRIMPRSKEDIIRQSRVNTDTGQVLGEVAASDLWQVEPRDKKMELLKYLLILAGGVIIVLIGFLIKIKIQNKNQKENDIDEVKIKF